LARWWDLRHSGILLFVTGDGQAARRPYSPSPRPNFQGPAFISAQTVTRHIWGDETSGEVADWIYASTDLIHCLVFGLAPGGSFTHSPEYRTIFGADEVLSVLSGTLVLANPELGEVLRVETGHSVAFGADTWHHAFAHGGEALRVLEFLAPPPSAGTTGAYARTRDYLETSSYADDELLGTWPRSGPRSSTLSVVRDEDIVWRRDLGVLAGVLSSTPQLTAMQLELNPGEISRVHSHGGDEVIYATHGNVHVRAWFEETASVFELGPGDACFLPHGAAHLYANYGSAMARALTGVAPTYLP
jgi:quercetin dioxygenase-like cupin family protein